MYKPDALAALTPSPCTPPLPPPRAPRLRITPPPTGAIHNSFSSLPKPPLHFSSPSPTATRSPAHHHPPIPPTTPPLPSPQLSTPHSPATLADGSLAKVRGYRKLNVMVSAIYKWAREGNRSSNESHTGANEVRVIGWVRPGSREDLRCYWSAHQAAVLSPVGSGIRG